MVIDWAWLESAALGEDLAVLCKWFGRAPGRPTDEQLLGTYVAGLRQAGWAGDAQLVRLGWALAVALRYLAHPLMLAGLDESNREHFERQSGRRLEDLLTLVSEMFRRALWVATEARHLLRSL